MRGRETLRRFNRTYTQRIGVLEDSFLESGRPLGPARVLFEVGPAGADVSTLRERLGLDSGYLSRLLRSLEGDGAIAVEPDPGDGRRRRARLTPAGLAQWQDLDRRSDRLADEILSALSDRQREQLETVLSTADRLIRAATVTFDAVDPAHPEAHRVMGEYFAELDERFETGFDAAEALRSDADVLDEVVLMRTDGEAIACGSLSRIDDQTVEIKRMWVDGGWRGLGLGMRMLRQLERRAGELGFQRIVLDTNPTLTEAISMYERAAYSPIGRYNDNPHAGRWFEKVLREARET